MLEYLFFKKLEIGQNPIWILIAWLLPLNHSDVMKIKRKSPESLLRKVFYIEEASIKYL